MANTLNATTAGIISTGDSNNLLQIQTNNLTAISIDGSQLVSFPNALGSTLKPVAGTTSVAPVTFTAGPVLTTPVAGSIEYDGTVFSGTESTTNGRGYLPNANFFRLTADSSAIGPGITNYFGATSGLTLDAGAFYELEAVLFFTKTTAGTATFTIAFTNAPVNNDAFYVGTPVGGVGTAGTAQTAALAKSTALLAALPGTGSLTTAVNHQYVVRSMFQANATTGGTINVQITSGAGTTTPLTGSYYKLTRLPSTNTGTFV